jgi:hypothetical protein
VIHLSIQDLQRPVQPAKPIIEPPIRRQPLPEMLPRRQE